MIFQHMMVFHHSQRAPFGVNLLYCSLSNMAMSPQTLVRYYSWNPIWEVWWMVCKHMIIMHQPLLNMDRSPFLFKAFPLGKFGGPFLWVILLGHFGGPFWWSILVGPFGGPFWWALLVRPFGGQFQWNILK